MTESGWNSGMEERRILNNCCTYMASVLAHWRNCQRCLGISGDIESRAAHTLSRLETNSTDEPVRLGRNVRLSRDVKPREGGIGGNDKSRPRPTLRSPLS